MPYDILSKESECTRPQRYLIKPSTTKVVGVFDYTQSLAGTRNSAGLGQRNLVHGDCLDEGGRGRSKRGRSKRRHSERGLSKGKGFGGEGELGSAIQMSGGIRRCCVKGWAGDTDMAAAQATMLARTKRYFILSLRIFELMGQGTENWCTLIKFWKWMVMLVLKKDVRDYIDSWVLERDHKAVSGACAD